MCGITGVAGDLTAKEEGLFKQLLIVDSLRGVDSTGVGAFGPSNVTMIAKQPGDPYQLFDSVKFQDILRRKNTVLIGHNRWATTGKVTRANAHPFNFKTLFGVHNGTLHNKWDLDKNNVFGTDSEALYHNIEQNGLQETIRKTKGAWSLVWYNKERNSINFLRNEERPMFITFSENKKALFWASEFWMLSSILGREGYKHQEILQLEKDMHVEYTVPQTNQVFGEAGVTKVEAGPFFQHQQSTITPATLQQRTYPTISGNISKKKENPTKSALFGQNSVSTGSIVVGDCYQTGVTADGAHYVSVAVDDQEDLDVRIYTDTHEDAKAYINLRIKGCVGRIKWINGNWIYKLDRAAIIPIEKTVVRLDHMNNQISKEEFERRYKNCGWCDAELTYEEEFEALGYNECICEDCANDAQVRDLIPGLRSN